MVEVFPEQPHNWILEHKQLLIIAGVSIFLLILVIRLVAFYLPKKPAFEIVTNSSESAHINRKSELKVDISGAVIDPGVYELSSSSRIEDAIKRAGGLSQDANREWVAQYLNLAAPLSDGMKIFIPDKKAVEKGILSVQNGGVVAGINISNGLISINNGSKSDLDSLPGVGEVTAEKIISGRPYLKITELVDKKAVNKSTFEKIKDKLSL